MQLIYTVSAAVLAGLAAAQGASLTANTPGSLFQCQNGLLTWSGGVPPYNPRINMAGSTTSTIELLPQTSATSYTWRVNLPEGTTFTLALVDNQGTPAYSGISPAIGPGDSSCLNSTTTAVTGGSSSTASGSSTMMSSTAAQSPTSSSMSRTTSASLGSSPAATTTAASSGNGAGKIQGYAGVAAGALGVIVAALI